MQTLVCVKKFIMKDFSSIKKQTITSKILTTTLFVLTLFSCTQNSIENWMVQIENGEEQTENLSRYRSYEEALMIAQEAVEMLEENNATRSGKPRVVSTNSVQYIVHTSSTRSSKGSDTLMYVFNYENDEGFAVISANRETEDLIAVAEQGHYIVGEDTENKGFELFMNMAEEYIKTTKEDNPIIMANNDGPVDMCELVHITRKRLINSYGPFVTTRWGQDAPYNQYCVTDTGTVIAAGCLITAVAQILSYYEFPTQIAINYEGGAYTLPLNWSEIKKHLGGYPYTCTCTEHETISLLFRQLGYRLGANYWIEDNGGSPHLLNETFRLLGYNQGQLQPYSSSVVQSSLSQGQLVCISAYSSEGFEGGHAWVIDGYRTLEETKIEYSRNTVTGEMTELWRDITRTNRYNHFNWGWDGNYNGYYLCDVFDVQKYNELDFGVSSMGTGSYPYNVRIFPYITH